MTNTKDRPKLDALTRVDEAPLPVALVDRVRATVRLGSAANTRRAYRADWELFTAWCAAKGRKSLPASPDTVAAFLREDADGRKYATVARRLTAIAHFHHLAGIEDSPTKMAVVQKTLKGLRSELGVIQARKAPLRVDHIVRMLPSLSVQERAVVLIGFATALRRSELAALTIEDLRIDSRGLLVHLRKSKTDQAGEGRWIGVHRGKKPETCPVLAAEAWLKARQGIGAESLFGISDKQIARIVQRAAKNIGLDPKLYGGHSLRAGLVTEADERGVPRHIIRSQTGHKSDAMLERYVRPEDAFKQNVTDDIGL